MKHAHEIIHEQAPRAAALTSDPRSHAGFAEVLLQVHLERRLLPGIDRGQHIVRGLRRGDRRVRLLVAASAVRAAEATTRPMLNDRIMTGTPLFESALVRRTTARGRVARRGRVGSRGPRIQRQSGH